VNQTRIITTASPILNVVGPDQDVVWVGKPDKSGNSISLAARKPGSVQLEIIDIFHHSQTLEIVVQPDLQSLQAEIDQIAPGHHVIVGSANGTIVLHGHVPSADLADKLVQMAAPFGPRVINMLEISGGQQVTLQVRFAEVSKDAVSALGVNFGIAGNSGFGANIIGGVGPLGISSTAGGAPSLAVGTPGANVTAFAQLTAGKTPFDIFVNALRDNNLLRVLAEPNLTVMSGNQASFLAGGEFPYPVPQSGGAGGGSTTITIDYKQYGVRLLFTPVVLGDGRIRLHVQPEVSDLDYTHSLTLEGFVIPALTTRTADTVVELSEGQTLSMAGLLNNRVNATSTVTPLLGDLPILGALFRSVRYERQETELVVLVTPLLAGPMDPAQVPPVPGEQWRYPSEGQLFLKNDLGGPMADAAHAPKPTAPRQFQGTYGFTPATTPGVANGK
jgi:pilus assembly protein CpaC